MRLLLPTYTASRSGYPHVGIYTCVGITGSHCAATLALIWFKSDPLATFFMFSECSNKAAIDGLPVYVLSYIFAWHRGSSGQPPWVRLLHSLGHCHLARLCKIYSAQRYETVNGLATNVPLHYPELNWSGCLYDLNFGIKNELNKI